MYQQLDAGVATRRLVRLPRILVIKVWHFSAEPHIVPYLGIWTRQLATICSRSGHWGKVRESSKKPSELAMRSSTKSRRLFMASFCVLLESGCKILVHSSRWPVFYFVSDAYNCTKTNLHMSDEQNSPKNTRTLGRARVRTHTERHREKDSRAHTHTHTHTHTRAQHIANPCSSSSS